MVVAAGERKRRQRGRDDRHTELRKTEVLGRQSMANNSPIDMFLYGVHFGHFTSPSDYIRIQFVA